MYKIELVRYALANQCDDTTVYKIEKIKEHYFEIIHDGEFLYNFKDKDEACQYLTDLLITKSADDVLILDNNDRDLIKLVFENKSSFDENVDVLGDIKEKAKSFKYTIFEYETIEDYKAALEDFVMNDETVIVDNDLTDNNGAAVDMSTDEKEISEMLDDEFDELCEMEMLGRQNTIMESGAKAVMSDDETPDMDKISEMLDDEFDALCDTEHREMLNGKELPTKPKYAIAERALGLDATDWNLMESRMIYSDLGTAIDFKPNNYINGLCRKQFEVVNLSDPNWKQSLIENDDEEYFVMKREVIRSGTDATDWEIDSDIFETWSEANANMHVHKDYGNFQFIIASRPKEKEEKKVDTRRRIFNFGD